MLQAVPGETVERHWGIAVRGSENGSETEIARLAVGDDGTLGLEWQPAAVTHPAAPHLANCVLSLESAGESHRMLLREAAQVDELVVHLEKPTHEGEIRGRANARRQVSSSSTEVLVEPPAPPKNITAAACCRYRSRPA